MKLATQARSVIGKKGKLLRKVGQVPGVIYGRHLTTPLTVSFDKVQLVKAIHTAGRNTPVELTGDGIDQLVLFHDIQLDPVTDHVIHVDCLAVKKDEKVHAEVPVVLVGVSPVVKNNLGTIQLIKSQLEVEAFPLDLPHDIQIDISVIEEIGQTIRISDLNLGDKVELMDDPEETILSAAAFQEEEVEETPAAESTEGAVEGAKEGDAKVAAADGKADDKDKK